MIKANFTNVSNEDKHKWKMTSNGRLPQISKVKYLSNYWSDLPQIFKLRLIWLKQTLQIFQMKTTSNGRLPQISKVKYLSIYWLNRTQNLNFGFYNQSKLYKCFKWRWPSMEDDLKWKTTSNIKSVISCTVHMF